MEKSKLLDRCGAEGEDRLLLAKVLDRAAQAEERNIPACTDFLSPQQQMMAGDLLRASRRPLGSVREATRERSGTSCFSCRTGWSRRRRSPRSDVCGRPSGRTTG